MLLCTMRGLELAPRGDNDTESGKEGDFPVSAGAESLCQLLGGARQGEEENAGFARREAGATEGQCLPRLPVGPGSHWREPGMEHIPPLSEAKPLIQACTSHSECSVLPKFLKSQTKFICRKVFLRGWSF